MNIALVFPPFYEKTLYNLPPLGLIKLAGMMKNSSHCVNVLDLVLELRNGAIRSATDIYDQCSRHILTMQPDVVGFSTQCTTYPAVIRIAERLKKKKPSLKLFIGGHNASFVDEDTLTEFTFIDAVIRGEGERTFQELMLAYAAGSDESGIEGVTWRCGNRVLRNPDRALIEHLDDLPLPDYRFVSSLESYRSACGLPRSIAILEVGRGCPHRCVYCSESKLWRRRTRTYSVERLVREMRDLSSNFGAQCFLLAYDQFTADRSFVTAFCRSVLEAALNRLPWYCISRLDTVDADLVHLMKAAGCESMCYGIDSGSKKTLAFIHKSIDEAILYSRVRETTNAGIVPTLSFVIGFPEEQIEDIDATLSLALKTGVQGNSNPLIQLPTVLPGTELHERYTQQLVREVDTYFSRGIEFDGSCRLEQDDMLIEKYPAIFSSFYNLPCPALPINDLDSLARGFPLMVNLFPRSFLLMIAALQESPAALFLQFLQKAKSENNACGLTPSACYRLFPGFARQRYASLPDSAWNHIPDIIEYELAAIEVARFSENETPGTADVCRLQHNKPVRKKSILVKKMSFDVPCIIEDMKSGDLNERYPETTTLLIFKQDGRELEVSEINTFGRDFLDLCNGRHTLEDISEKLYDRYGSHKDEHAFLTDCREAARALFESKLLEAVHADA